LCSFGAGWRFDERIVYERVIGEGAMGIVACATHLHLDQPVAIKLLRPETSLTHTDALIGTPSFMSPEQIESSKHVDARTEIWALGVTLYQLVSSRLPFRAETLTGMLRAVTTQPMRSLRDMSLPVGLEEVIARCLANTVRLHSAIGFVTPHDKLAGREHQIWRERDRKLEQARQRRDDLLQVVVFAL
jgi:serine/threonine protein kinase